MSVSVGERANMLIYQFIRQKLKLSVLSVFCSVMSFPENRYLNDWFLILYKVEPSGDTVACRILFHMA